MGSLSLPPKAKLSLEDLFIAVYCCAEEEYRLLFGSQSALRKSNNSEPAFTDAEVIFSVSMTRTCRIRASINS